MKEEFIKWENILENEGLGLLPEEKINLGSIDSTWEKAVDSCNGICSECIETHIGENNVRINVILCCPYHPETKKVSEQGYCTEIDLETGLCNVYQTDEYPGQCEGYHCKKDGR